MQQALHKRMLRDVEELRALLARASTEGICLKVFLLLSDTHQIARDHGLLAPFRQFQYLLGLLLTTPEPRNHSTLAEGEWQGIFQRLGRIYNAYAAMFWPSEEDSELWSMDDWYRPRSVAMPAFLHYFSQGSMASVEQTIARIEATIVPFDRELTNMVGISATDAIAITKWICNDAEARLEKSSSLLRFMMEQHEKARQLGWDPDTARRHVQSTPEYLQHLKTIQDPRTPLSVSLRDLEELISVNTAAAYWSLFASRRGLTPDFTYPTELNPVVQRPLIEFAEGKAAMVVGNMLYEAVLARLGTAMANDKRVRQRYFARRDSALEQQVSALVRRLFPDGEHYAECYEQPNSQYEHDHVAVWQRWIFVFESKASPPPEPFRDPTKAYERIRRAFKSETGIQAAFNQARRLRMAHTTGDPIRLYNKTGTLLREVTASECDAVYCICVTAQSHGPLAVDLSLLLEKEDAEPFPWAVSAIDLESTVGAFERKRWGPDRFRVFLDQRQCLHGKVLSDDELEIVGAFILHGTLEPWLARPEEKLTFLPGYSKVFDAIYNEQHGGPAAELEAKHAPHFHDYGLMLKALAEGSRNDGGVPIMAGVEPLASAPARKRVRRNDPCPCGSGKKSKRCCYRE